MSNTERDPVETICVEDDPVQPGLIEILEPRDVPLGGIRAMTVRRTLPQRDRTLIGAWCFVDHYGPDDVAATGGMNVRAHPHTGLQTVSWLFSGTIEHRDSAGNHAMVVPGELNLMTAGSGISHSERSTEDTSVLHGVQLWVALPEASRHTDKRFDHYAPEVIVGAGWRAQVFLGALLGHESPVPTHSPLVGAEIVLEPEGTIEFAVDPAFEHGVLVDTGAVTVACGPAVRGTGSADTPVARSQLAYCERGVERLSLVAGPEGARVVFLGGEPFGERIVMWWNFIGRSHDEIVAAREGWQSLIDEEDASTAAASRFGLPDDEPEPPLPAPATPIARLLPRG